MALINTCFWCLKPLDKTLKFNIETDTMAFNGYEPCDTCKELFSRGIQVLGVSKSQTFKQQPAITVDKDNNCLYPTGRMFLAPEEWVRSFLSEDEERIILEAVIKHKVMLLPDHVLEDIMNELNKNDCGYVDNDALIQKEQQAVVNKKGI